VETIHLMLVDDHDVVRTGLKAFLESQPGLEVVAEASSGESAIQMVSQSQPDVVVMDITMPGMGGMEATRRLKLAYPATKVLVLTVHTDKQYFFEMLEAGAVGYLTKQAAADELVAAIHAVAAGQVYLQPALALWLLEDYRRVLSQLSSHGHPGGGDESDGKDLAVLSKRELQVLERVAQGMTNSEIGEDLGISPKTVARHRERIMAKLNLHSIAELVRFAIRTGLIDAQ
jgi:two-component system response regulator NreC